jgi:hypothetical protein
MKFPDYFDPRKPSVKDIRSRFGDRFIDLSEYDGLSHADVAEAVLDTSKKPGYGLIIPDTPGVYGFWDDTTVRTVQHKEVCLDSALRFMRFGDEINLTKRATTKKQFREQNMSPRSLFRNVLGSPDNRKSLLNESHRGVGWYHPQQKNHKLIPFDVFAEGRKFMDFYGNEMIFEYQANDAYVTVPSLSKRKREDYVVTIRVLPVDKNNYFHEWAATEIPNDDCEDKFFRGAASQVKADKEIEGVYKFAVPEDQACRHGWGCLEKAQERSGEYTHAKPFLVKFPVATGLIAPWHTLKTKTIVKRGNREVRPRKVDIRIQLGRIIGYAGPESLFDLTE